MPPTKATGWDAVGNPIPGDVASCLVELGIDFKVNGDEAVGKCPMHYERTGKEDAHPSWSVRLEDSADDIPAGTFNCFACGYRGGFVQLVADVTKWDWFEAVAWVRARGGIERARMVLERHKQRDNKVDTTQWLNEASLALFVDPPQKALDKRNLDPFPVSELGIRWDTDKDAWILPIRDPNTHELWGWQEKNDRYFRNRPTDVKKSHTLFGLDAYEGEVAVILESPLDVARLYTAGIPGGLSSFGAAISDKQMALIIAHADKVIMALDNDRDGMKYSEMMRTLHARRINMSFLNYDGIDAKDVGEMTDEQIFQAYSTATSSTVTRFKVK